MCSRSLLSEAELLDFKEGTILRPRDSLLRALKEDLFAKAMDEKLLHEIQSTTALHVC